MKDWLRPAIGKIGLNTTVLGRIFTLLSGTVLAQLVNILLIPVITRFYPPQEMGVSETFVAYVLILVVGVNGGLELAMILPKSKGEAYQISRLGNAIALVVCTALFVLLLLFQNPLISLLHLPQLHNWILLLPLSLLLEGLSQNFRLLLTREARYSYLSIGKVLNILVRNGISLVFGFLHFSFELLIIAFVMGQLANTLVFAWGLRRVWAAYFVGRLRETFHLTSQYKDFIRYGMLSACVNIASKRLPFMLFPFFLAESELLLGVYSQADKLLTIPFILSIAVGDVYYQRASELARKDESALLAFTQKTLKSLLLLGLLPYSLVLLSNAETFAFVLGNKYADAGLYAAYFTLQNYLLFAFAPITFLIDIRRKLKSYLYVNIALFVAKLLLLLIGLSQNDGIFALQLYGIGGGLLTVLQMAYVLYVARLFPSNS